MNLWKQNDHVLGILLADEGPKEPKTFLQKFYEGELFIVVCGHVMVVSMFSRTG